MFWTSHFRTYIFSLIFSAQHFDTLPLPKRRRIVREPAVSGSDSEETPEIQASKANEKNKQQMSRGKAKKKTLSEGKSVHFNGDVIDEEDMDEENLMGLTERRATPKTNYDETSAHCPLPGCDSKGNFSKPYLIVICLMLQKLFSCLAITKD